MDLQTTLAALILLWIAAGLLKGRPEWLERRTGLVDGIAGNATVGDDI